MSERLVESSLWKEDLFVNGHKSVWGSWFDTEAKKWGYACCRGFDKGGSCSSAAQASKGKNAANSDDDDSSDESVDSEEAKRRAAEKPFDWSNPPPELLPKAEVSGGEAAAFLEHFVRWGIGAWRAQAEADTAFTQTEAGLAPFLERLASGEVPTEVLSKMDKMVSLAAEREYQASSAAYMELSLGHKKWNNVFAGANAMNTNKGARINIIKQDTLLAFDSDPVAQRYIQAMRKLIMIVQSMRPNEDASKNLRH